MNMCGNDCGNLSKSKLLGPNLINVGSVRQDPGIYIFNNHSDDAWKRLRGRAKPKQPEGLIKRVWTVMGLQSVTNVIRKL